MFRSTFRIGLNTCLGIILCFFIKKNGFIRIFIRILENMYFNIKSNDKYLDYYESLMISKYNTMYPNGLNLKIGGSNGVIFSKETM